MDATRRRRRGARRLLLTLALLAGCAAGAPGAGAQERVELPLEPGWTLLGRTGVRGTRLLEYVPAGESAEGWTRFVSVQTFADAEVPFPGAGWAMAECRTLLLERCPGAAWTVLRESPDDALYEWRVAGCAAEPDQHEVGRVMRGRDSWTRVTFSVKGAMDPALRQEWLRRLDEARLVPGRR